MPTPNPVSPADHRLYNTMIAEIHALEFVAKEYFLAGDHARRRKIATKVKERVADIQRTLFPVLAPGSSAAAGPDTIFVSTRCPYPYIESGGICVLSGNE